jgi:hypothetical protein
VAWQKEKEPSHFEKALPNKKPFISVKFIHLNSEAYNLTTAKTLYKFELFYPRYYNAHI